MSAFFTRWWAELKLTLSDAGMVRPDRVQFNDLNTGTGTGADAHAGANEGIPASDIRYAVFLVALTMIPAVAVFFATVRFGLSHPSDPAWRPMADLLGAPLQTVITGFLMSAFLFLGAHFNRVPRPFAVAFRAMLQVMSLQPVLGFLLLWRGGAVLVLLVYGFFTGRAAARVYAIPARNAAVFYGGLYLMFALLQMKTFVR